MPRATVDLAALLQALSTGQVACIIVGGMAAVLHGASTTTQDLDIVPEQSEDNLDRLPSHAMSPSPGSQPAHGKCRVQASSLALRLANQGSEPRWPRA